MMEYDLVARQVRKKPGRRQWYAEVKEARSVEHPAAILIRTQPHAYGRTAEEALAALVVKLQPRTQPNTVRKTVTVP